MTPRADLGPATNARLTMAPDRGWPRRRRVLLATVLVMIPIASGGVLLFGGSQVDSCLGGLNRCAGLPRPEPVPVIGKPEGLVMVGFAMFGGWLVAAWMTVRHLWSTDRAHLRLAAAAPGVLVFATVVVVGATLRGWGPIVGAPLFLAWAILAADRTSPSLPAEPAPQGVASSPMPG